MVVQVKKTYRVFYFLVIGAVFYFGVMVKTVKADACVDMFGGILDQVDHTYVLTGDLIGTACILYANNITIDGSGIYKIQAVVASDKTDGVGGANGSDAFDFTIKNIIDNSLWNNQIQSIGGNSDSGIAGSGGNVTIENSTMNKKVNSRGGYSSSGTPGTSGTVTIRNSTIRGAYTIGAGTYGYSNGANGGNIIIENSYMYALSASGGYSYGGGDGGNGGSVIIENSVIQTQVASDGGYGSYFYGNGGNITVINSSIDTVSNEGFVTGSLTITDDAPTVTLTGDENMTIAFEDVYAESGATAEDVKYTTTDLTGDIDTAGTVDAPAGVYDITYTVTDDGTLPTWNGVLLAGLPGIVPNTTIATRHVTRSPAPDVTPPVITLAGDSTMSLTVGDTFVDPGATALDAVDGVVAAVASGSVNTNIAGTYIITYTATDAALNESTATLTVTVVAARRSSSGFYMAGYGSKAISKVPLTTTTAPVISEIQKVTKDLKLGMKNNDVKTLQLFLISQNKGVAAKALVKNGATNYFGKLTRSALAEWQKENKITPSAGYFGKVTRAKIKLLNL